MTSVEFLRAELSLIAEKFQNVHIKYGFNSKIETHIVELLPLIEYTSNRDLDNAWIPLSIKFMETFKDEEIAFISSDSSLSLKEFIFEFNAGVSKEENFISEILVEPIGKQLKIYSYSFPTCMPNSTINATAISLGNLLKEPVANLYSESNTDLSYSLAA
jgi:hypothetical protein